MASESIDWAIHSNKNLILLLLDFEKAYDRVSWTFMQQTMKQMGFSETFIGWIMALYSEASTAITLKRVDSPTFQLERAVRQGC